MPSKYWESLIYTVVIDPNVMLCSSSYNCTYVSSNPIQDFGYEIYVNCELIP